MAEYKGIILSLGVVAGIALLAKQAGAQPPEPPKPGLANLHGTAVDAVTRNPLSGVRVVLNGKVTSTNKQGYYQVLDLNPGNYSIDFEKGGYIGYSVI